MRCTRSSACVRFFGLQDYRSDSVIAAVITLNKNVDSKATSETDHSVSTNRHSAVLAGVRLVFGAVGQAQQGATRQKPDQGVEPRCLVHRAIDNAQRSF